MVTERITIITMSEGAAAPSPPREDPAPDAFHPPADCGPVSPLLRLLAWLSPSFPVGAFSYSHGLEWAVEAGTVRDAAGLTSWVEGLVRHGGGWSDAVLLCGAWRASTDGDLRRAADLAELAAALQPSHERRLESVSQGAAFLSAVETVWPSPLLGAFRQTWSGDTAYPVAVGLAGAIHGLPLHAVAAAYLHAFAANIISAGIRLIPLGQTDGLRVTALLEPAVAETVETAMRARLDDLGSASFLADIASMRHETQYTRLFRS